jgi:glucose 1-dehydrogenase
MRLKDKVALVTGAARGIGRACAERLQKEGAQVVLSDIDAAEGAATTAKIGAPSFLSCDVGDRGQVEALVQGTIRTFGHIDILVNNAGILASGEFLDISEADFDRVIRVNLKGAFLVGQAVARKMVEQVKAGRPAGAIINMSSTNAVVAIPTQVPYTVSKGGINQLTKIMALALAPHGIRVNAVGPGSINTDIFRTVASDKAAMHRVLSRTPLGRVGEPSEVASVVAFLASEDASYLTGQTIYPDGGRLPLNYTVPVKET